MLPQEVDSITRVAGTLEPLRTSNYPVYSPSGSRERLAAISVDLTGIIKAFSQLLGSMGHDSSFLY